jgi:hypothetical protein
MTLDPTKEELEALLKRYPSMKPPEPRYVVPVDPLHVQRYPSMFSPELRDEATRALAAELQPPAGVSPSDPAFLKFKRDMQAAGFSTAEAAKLLAEIFRTGGG